MLDLHLGARPDERFHLQTGCPVPHVLDLKIFKRVSWSMVFLEDGTPGTFVSWWLFGNAIHWYRGNVKCDGSRTRWYWAGGLDNGIGAPYVAQPTKYVMTTTPKEKFSVRFFVDPGTPTWDGMGGA